MVVKFLICVNQGAIHWVKYITFLNLEVYIFNKNAIIKNDNFMPKTQTKNLKFIDFCSGIGRPSWT